MHIHICAHIHIHICTYDVYMYLDMHVCTYISLYIDICINMYILNTETAAPCDFEDLLSDPLRALRGPDPCTRLWGPMSHGI